MAMTLGLSVLAVLSCVGTPRSFARQLFAAYFACLSVDSIIGLIRVGWPSELSAESVRWLHVANVPIGYLLGPLLYGCIVALTVPSVPGSESRLTRHLLPYFLVLVVSLGNATYAFDTFRWGGLVFQLTYHAWVLHGLVYLTFACRRVYLSRPQLEDVNSDGAILRLHWLYRFVGLNAVVWGLIAIDRAYDVARIAEGPWLSGTTDVLDTLALLVLAWLGLHLPRVTLPNDTDAVTAEATGENTARYARSGLDPDQCTRIAAELSSLMESKRLYVDSQLDMQTLSRYSGWPPNYISQALNQGLERNFFEFVNGFRVAAAERCLSDPTDRRTILEVALACGFGSKSTFNAVFKRLTGRTPSEIRRNRAALAGDQPA